MSVSAYRLRDLIVTDYLASGAVGIGQKLPSTKEISVRYGVSGPTVSKAFSFLVADGWVVARRGYGVSVVALPSADARHYAQPDRRIGCIVPGLDRVLAHRVFEGVERVARRQGCIVEVAATEWDMAEERRQVAGMRVRGVQGIVLYPTTLRSQAPEYLAAEFTDYPIVAVDLYEPSMRRPHLIFDNVQAGRDMIRYLLEQDRHEIAFLKFQDDIPYRSVDDRLLGYRRALADAGEPFDPTRVVSFVGSGPWTADFHAAMERVLSLKPRPTAIVMPYDPYAEAGIAWLRRKGLRVPEDVVAAGFDNLQHEPWAERFPTTQPDFVNLGERATETLLDCIRTRDMTPTGLILPCPLLLPDPLPAIESWASTAGLEEESERTETVAGGV
jgi:DNA-binding LacI/PurR family transcriptional regulator